MKKIAIILTLFTLASCVSSGAIIVSEKTHRENNKKEIMYFAMKDCQNLKRVNEAELSDSPFQQCVVRRSVANGYLEQ